MFCLFTHRSLNRELVPPLDTSNLWDIWYTRDSPVPSDASAFSRTSSHGCQLIFHKTQLVDPAFRSVIISGLAHPEDYIAPSESSRTTDLSLPQLPDTHILFKRYLDSGKSVNVYDLFEAFRATLESQLDEMEGEKAASSSSSPRKRSKSPSKKSRGRAIKHEPLSQDQAQTRFLRAFQELDFVGLFKHGGRKADHVQRTVFDVVE